MILPVSACLLGIPCRYDGQSQPCPELLPLWNHHTFLPVCPEMMGGLAVPRVPAERQGEMVITREGRDVTNAYRQGAKRTLALLKQQGCSCILLKENSPSCGCGRIYDGTFSGILAWGNGVTAQLLQENGIQIFGECQICAWKEFLGL